MARATLIEFFLKPVLADDAFNASCTDHESRLAELLRDDFGGSVWIEKTAANDLPLQFIRFVDTWFSVLELR